jgi:arylsulfatase A-like enzyme
MFFDHFEDIAGGSLFPSGMNVKAELRSVESSGVSFLGSLLWRCLKHPRPFRSLGNTFATKAESFFDGRSISGVLDDGASSVVHRTMDHVSDTTEPVFVFTNFMEAHEPYRTKRFYDETDVPNTWSSNKIDKWDINTGSVTTTKYLDRYRTVYEQSIRYLDRVVADFIDRLRQQTDRETTVIVTADHGQNLGFEYEDGLIGHKASLSEGLLHVPCEIVNPPDSLDIDPQRLHSHLDIGRLITSIAHETRFKPETSDECLPAEVLGIGTESDNVPEEERTYWNREIRCIYERDTKTQWDSLEKVFRFDISADRASWQRQLEEDVDIPSCAVEVFERPIGEIRRETATGFEDDINKAVREQMRELGYI